MITIKMMLLLLRQERMIIIIAMMLLLLPQMNQRKIIKENITKHPIIQKKELLHDNQKKSMMNMNFIKLSLLLYCLIFFSCKIRNS